jgi:hypothetical protein
MPKKTQAKAQRDTLDSVDPGTVAIDALPPAALEHRVLHWFCSIYPDLSFKWPESSYSGVRTQVEPGGGAADAGAPALAFFMCVGNCTGGAAHPASCHCVDCGEDYCEQLAAAHRQFKATRDHTLVPVAEKGRAVSTLCPVHLDEKLKSYCSTCAQPVCVLCVAETHIPAQLVNPDGPTDGPKHKVISLADAGRATDANLQRIYANASDLAATYGVTAAAVQVFVSCCVFGIHLEIRMRRLCTWFDRPPYAMSPIN